MNESSIDLLKSRLQAHKGRWPVVAAGAGVPVSTVRKIAQGHTKNPRIETVDALNRWFSSAPVTPSGVSAPPN